MYIKAIVQILVGALVSVALFTGCAPGPASTTPPIGNGGPTLLAAPPSANHYGDDKYVLHGPIGVVPVARHTRHHAGQARL